MGDTKVSLELFLNSIGNYLGDVWEFNFSNMAFTEVKLEGADKNSINRSNQTAVFYEKANSYASLFDLK